MKKIILPFILILLLLVSYLGWRFFGPCTSFSENKKTIYIHTGQNDLNSVMNLLKEESVIRNKNLFNYLVKKMNTENKIRPGKYIIKKGTTLFTLVQKFRNNDQESVNLVITKLRTKQDFAKLVSKKFECDSITVINMLNTDSTMKEFNVTTETAFTFILPNTYSFFWTSTPMTIFKSLYRESEKFWNEERVNKASKLGITPKQAYIIASIVEEETNAKSDKPLIASVYLNRIRLGMPLQADPTVKFALQDFGIKRVLQGHLQVQSPYNTYINRGLPPGPVCTPALNTIDSVLNATKTNYLYFVANSDFSGTHIFTTNYADHLKYAREYQKALTILMETKRIKSIAE